MLFQFYIVIFMFTFLISPIITPQCTNWTLWPGEMRLIASHTAVVMTLGAAAQL